MSALYIDDRQPPVRQPDFATTVKSIVVGPAVAQRVGHGFQGCDRDGACPPGLEDAADPTHNCLTSTAPKSGSLYQRPPTGVTMFVPDSGAQSAGRLQPLCRCWTMKLTRCAVP